MQTHKTKHGFSLIEIIVFVSILNLVFVAAASFIVSSLYRMKINEHKTRALFYAEELKEWLNGMRDADWYTLKTISGSTYCVNDQLSLDSDSSILKSGACTFDGIRGIKPAIFRRRLQLTTVSSSQIRADITVDWSETAVNGTQVNYSQMLPVIYSAW